MMALLLLLFWIGPQDETSVVLIVSADTPITSLTSYQLKQLYLGKFDHLNEVHLVPLALRKGHPLRDAFEARYLGQPVDLEQYWLNESLSGGAREPLVIADWALLVAYVRRNPGYVGYIPAQRAADATTQGLRILEITDP